MKQLIQNFKTGDLYVDDLPSPSVSAGMVLIESAFSLISPGTERGTVKVAQSSLLGKAKQRPDLVAQVLQNLKKEGWRATFNKVKTKLDSLKALGYSSAGTVISSLDTNGIFRSGDRVACAGQDYASHAEIVSIPQNLVAKIPDNVSFEEAAFTTIGAIALQGVRQADVRLGEKVCIIGLGLIGQITGQLLKANGCDVFGIDLSDKLISLAENLSVHKALNRHEVNLIAATENFTNGHGFDAVIITAASSSNDPIELSAVLARKKGKIVVVGAVKMDIPRDPHFYRKELDLKMSCSYGPGRYDVIYEEQGQDYPIGYVRWTEQRNMDAFLNLLSKKLLDIQPLITHVFDIDDAEKAYDLVLGKNPEPSVGILLRYREDTRKHVKVLRTGNVPLRDINVGFVGAGSFAQSYLIPNVKASGASLDSVVTSKGITAKNVAEKFGFNSCSADVKQILLNKDINTVFIATPHSSHAMQTIEALKAGKRVFVEKPLAMSVEELESIIEVKKIHNQPLMVGFNRRFSPLSVAIKEQFKNTGEPLIINIRVNAGFIPKDHWTQVPTIGGGRIVGEMCHFIDLMQYFTESEPVKVHAECIATDNNKLAPHDNIVIVVRFSDGSIGNLCYMANGDKAVPKEYIEVFGGGRIGIIDNFSRGSVFSNNRMTKIKLEGKGHKEEIAVFLSGLTQGYDAPISFRSLCLTTMTTFRILDSLSTGLPQIVEINP